MWLGGLCIFDTIMIGLLGWKLMASVYSPSISISSNDLILRIGAPHRARCSSGSVKNVICRKGLRDENKVSDCHTQKTMPTVPGYENQIVRFSFPHVRFRLCTVLKHQLTSAGLHL